MVHSSTVSISDHATVAAPRPGERLVLTISVADAQAIVMSGPTPMADAAISQALCRHMARDDIRISRRPSGRPSLLPPYPDLSVSISRREDLTAAAFSSCAVVGVDVEYEDPRLDAVRMANDHFSRAEASAINGLSPAAARDVFLKLWCLKEAALKITGRGVFDGLCAPDLAAHIERLRRSDDVVVDTALKAPSSGERPIATRVRRFLRPDARAFYAALAASR